MFTLDDVDTLNAIAVDLEDDEAVGFLDDLARRIADQVRENGDTIGLGRVAEERR